MDKDLTRPGAMGSAAPAGNGEFALLNWPLGGIIGLNEANLRLGLTLGHRLLAAWARLGEIAEKAFAEFDAERSATLRHVASPGRSHGGDDVHPGQWEDIIADIEKWRLEVTEGFVAAWQDWQRGWTHGAIVDQPAQDRGELVLTPWPVVLAEPDKSRRDPIASG